MISVMNSTTHFRKKWYQFLTNTFRKLKKTECFPLYSMRWGSLQNQHQGKETHTHTQKNTKHQEPSGTYTQKFLTKTSNKAPLVGSEVKKPLPVQEARVWPLVREDPTCRRAAEPVGHGHWVCAADPGGRSCWAHCRKARSPVPVSPRRTGRPPPWRGPLSTAREKPAGQRRPGTANNMQLTDILKLTKLNPVRTHRSLTHTHSQLGLIPGMQGWNNVRKTNQHHSPVLFWA